MVLPSRRYLSSSSTDSEDAGHEEEEEAAHIYSMHTTANSTPLSSRPPSPNHLHFPSRPESPCCSGSESEDNPLYATSFNSRPSTWWRDDRRFWWSASRRGRRKTTSWKFVRSIRRSSRRLFRFLFNRAHTYTIILTLFLLCVFALLLTLLLMHILNPDKEPLPWRAYCAAPELVSYWALNTNGTAYPSFNASKLDDLPPAGVFVGVFSVDSAFERRMLVRTTWASHPRSREGAGDGDRGAGTSRTIVRFLIGQPRKSIERRVELEMDTYNDIIILPVAENMNNGKSYTYFSWAAINAWVPPIYYDQPVVSRFSYSNETTSPPPLAPHDPYPAWQDILNRKAKSWVRPDYVVKVDDDSFVMLAELEARLRYELHSKPSNPKDSLALPRDPLIYWGYLVTNRLHQFMAGELYALSWSLVNYVATEPAIKSLTRGKEDKQTAKWMRMHPNTSDIRWTSERCWIYDHPRSGTVYSHGFLFPSEVTRIRQTLDPVLHHTHLDQSVFSSARMGASLPLSWSRSSVSTFGLRYAPPVPDLSTQHSVEALVEGSEMSMLREGRPVTPGYAWTHREGRRTRYESARVGGTIVVHFVKKQMWFLETALALLEGKEMSEFEKYRSSEEQQRLLELEQGPTSAPQPTTTLARFPLRIQFPSR